MRTSTLRLPGETDAQVPRAHARAKSTRRSPRSRSASPCPASTYAYPYGDVNETVVDLLKRQGVRMGVTVTPGGNGFFAYPFMLRRSMVFGGDGLDAFKSKLATFAQAASR